MTTSSTTTDRVEMIAKMVSKRMAAFNRAATADKDDTTYGYVQGQRDALAIVLSAMCTVWPAEMAAIRIDRPVVMPTPRKVERLLI